MTEYSVFPEDEETVTAEPTVEAASVEDGENQDNKNKKGKESKLKKENRELTEKVAALEAALGERDDKYIRLAAEYDNFRKRTAKEKEGIYSDAYGEAIAAILPVIDNLERALDRKSVV